MPESDEKTSPLIRLGLPNGRIVCLAARSVLIGRAPECDISLPRQTNLQMQHARLRYLSGRWLIESHGDWPLSVNDGDQVTTAWLKEGDRVRLAAEGPELVMHAREDAGPRNNSAEEASGRAPTLHDQSEEQLTPPPLPTPRRRLPDQLQPPPLPPHRSKAEPTPPPLPKKRR
jgi:hypothetical protein